jgi:hypothetical protein
MVGKEVENQAVAFQVGQGIPNKKNFIKYYTTLFEYKLNTI